MAGLEKQKTKHKAMKPDVVSIKSFVACCLFDEAKLLQNDPTWPKISIVTPSFNQAAFLERTVLSVLNQNYPNLEYIIVDGGSTDSSVEIIKKYERYLAYWSSEKDNGQTSAINKGFKLATGEWIGWQNSDDIYLPGAFRKVAEMVGEFPEIDLFHGNIYEIDEDDNVLRDHRFANVRSTAFLYEGGIPFQGTFIHHKIIESCGPLDEKLQFCMDVEYSLRLVGRAKPLRIRDFLGAYRSHPQTKTSRIPDVRCEEYKLICRRMDVDITSARFRFIRLLCTIRRATDLLLQGDWDYVAKGIVRRIGRLGRIPRNV